MYFRMKALEERVAALEQEFATKIERENLRLPKRCKLIEIETEERPMEAKSKFTITLDTNAGELAPLIDTVAKRLEELKLAIKAVNEFQVTIFKI